MQAFVKERDLVLKKTYLKRHCMYGSDPCNVLEGGQLID